METEVAKTEELIKLKLLHYVVVNTVGFMSGRFKIL